MKAHHRNEVISNYDIISRNDEQNFASEGIIVCVCVHICGIRNVYNVLYKQEILNYTHLLMLIWPSNFNSN